MKIAGIDISKWQGDLNFTKVRDEGFDFAIIRAGSGTVADPMFETNYTKAKNSGMNVRSLLVYLRAKYSSGRS